MVSTEQRRHSLLYVAGRFMMVHIDKCAKARATRFKRQAASKPQARTKLQASSDKPQAPSHKLQAPGSRTLDKV